MTISNKVNPSADLRKFWKLVPKNIAVEESATHKAPALYAEVSGFIVLWYLLATLAISGDIYLAFKILMKAGVSPTVVIISVILDFFVAISPFLFNFKEREIRNKNQKLMYELDSQLEIIGEDNLARENRLKKNDLNLSKCNNTLDWCLFFKIIVIVAIAAIAGWKIWTFAGTVPYSITFSMKGKMVITVAILVAIFHLAATEKALIHFIYWFKKSDSQKRADRVLHQDFTPPLTETPIVYKADFRPVKSSGYTELVVDTDKKTTAFKYAYIIREEEIKELLAGNPSNSARKAIIAASRDLLNH